MSLRALRGPLSPRTLLVTAAVAVAVLWLVVVTGGLVRLTASGLGCPSWPLCESGRIVPAGSHHAAIEFGNRVISGIAVLATAALALVAWRTPAAGRGIRRGALAAAVGTAAQAPLGAVTVLTDLHPLAVMSHFLLAIAVVAVAVWTLYRCCLLAGALERPARRDGDSGIAALAVGAVLVLITTGAFVTAAGPHAGSTDVPIDRLGTVQDAAWVHVRAAVTYIALLAVLLWRLRRRGGPALRLVLATGALALAQFALGEYQYRNGLPWEAVAVHVSVAVTLVGATVATACETAYAGLARAARPAEAAPRAAATTTP